MDWRSDPLTRIAPLTILGSAPCSAASGSLPALDMGLEKEPDPRQPENQQDDAHGQEDESLHPVGKKRTVMKLFKEVPSSSRGC